jgi:hypothetical protein
LIVGGEDSSLANNRAFSAHPTRLRIPHTFTVPPGLGHQTKAILEALGEDRWAFYRAAFANANAGVGTGKGTCLPFSVSDRW